MAVMTTADDSRTARCAAIDWSARLAANQSWLRRVIAARTGEPAAVDEVWQQVALAAIEQRWPLADPAKVGAVAAPAGRDCRRSLLPPGRAGTAVGAEPGPGAGRRGVRGAAADPLALLLRRERLALTREALGRLPASDAEILMLKYGERWSYRQIAEHLGITEKAVDCRLLRARERLRRELAASGIDENEP